MSENFDNLGDNAGVVGLRDASAGVGVARGEVDSEALEGGGIAKGKIAADAARAVGAFAIGYEAGKIIVPDDALFEIFEAELLAG